MALPELLKSLHVLANLFWIGGIVATSLVLAGKHGSDKERGAQARSIYRTIAAPAFGISFLAALGRLLLDLKLYFVTTHFMHAKLPLALGVIAIHHIVGAKARRAESGEKAPSSQTLTWALVGLAAASALLATLKPF